MWFTVRFSVRAGTTLFSLIAVIAILATVANLGPFHLTGAERPLLSVGLMVVAFGVSTLAVGALVAERQLAEERLRESNEGLERRVRERTAELHRRATLDSLTGVCNRGHFFELATEAFIGARRHNASMAALLIDLDQLKTINDSSGHGAGDAAIVHVATVATEVLHESGIVGRLGGDEFAVVLPGMSCDDAAVIAGRLQERLRSDPVPWQGGTLVVSASVGVAALDQDTRDIDDLLRRADAAMYASKRGARASCLRA
jgi:diguanylate cyclase (GGDEF)-like protein